MTITATPPAYSSVNDFVLWTVYSPNAIDPTKLNYKYLGEIWIGGVKIYTGISFPNPTNGYGQFDMGKVLREYITTVLAPTSAGILAQELGQTKFALDVIFKVKETYLVGTTQTTSASTDDTTRTFFNHYNGRINNFTILSNYVNLPATTRPLNIDVTLTSDNYFLSYFATTTTPFTVVIAGQTKTITPSVANTLQVLNISPVAINNDYAGTITASTGSYTVALGGITYTVNVVCEPVYQVYTLHFLNKFGGFESMNFSKVSKKTYNVDRKAYQQLPYRVDNSGVVSVKTGNIMNQQKGNFAVKFDEKLKISTDLLNDDEYLWLSQVVFSPLVYLQDGVTFYPIIIAASNYEEKQTWVDGLTNLSLDIEFGTQYKTQFR